MKKYLVIIITFISLLNIDCNRQTKLFKNIEVQGRLVNFFTKEPIPNVEVRLRANDVHSSSSYAEARILLDSYTTNNDGSFILKSKASKEENYQIQIDTENHIYSSVDTFFSSQPNKIVNIGDIYFGEHTYWYKVRLIPTTGSCAWVYNQNQQFIKVNTGVDTTILYNSSISYYTLRENKNDYWFSYKTGSCINSNSAIYQNKTFQITSVDTMMLQINY